MTVTLVGHDHRYAVEQMALMLLGDLKGVDAALTVTLLDGDTAQGKYVTSERAFTARAFAHELGADTPHTQEGVEQRLVKLAAYRAITEATGQTPVWGALSGVRPAKLPTKWMRRGVSPEDARALLTGLYQLSPARADLTMTCAGESLKASASLSPDEVSLYIGIPFCPSRCVYCSFISAAVAQCLPLVPPFVDALCEELKATAQLLRRAGHAVRTVYMGGGTPTTLSPEQLDAILTALETNIDLSRCTEFTVEAGRPDTITPEKLSVLAAHKVGRVSVNPQSMNDDVLRQMGRPHTGADIRRAYDQVRAAGAFTVNMDLIAGLPGDSPAGFARSLGEVISLAPENITVHTLALKKGSRLTEERQALPTASQVETMLDGAWAALHDQGYAPYYLYRQKYMSGSFENVGWAKPGAQSLYNIVMMEELHSILALGGGGVTKLIHPATGSLTRYSNPKYPKEYLERLPQIIQERSTLPL